MHGKSKQVQYIEISLYYVVTDSRSKSVTVENSDF